jgi:phenylalanyl-tRNA synthetase beta chain
MVIVDTSFKLIQELVKEKISIEDLENTLADMGFELDEVEGDNIKIEITAERTDLVTPQGLARAIRSYKEITKGYQEIKTIPSKYEHIIDKSVKNIRPYTKSFVVKNIQLNEQTIKTLINTQEKIHATFGRKRKKVAIGVYDLEKIKFPITYKALDPKAIKFIPLDETKEMNAIQIIENHPKGKTYAHLLKNQSKYPIHIDANNQILSMPPIINSNNLGKITTQTKNLFVETTGTDEEALDNIMNILATMFYDLKGEIHQVKITNQETNQSSTCPSLKSSTRTIKADYVNKVIGINIDTKQTIELIPKMGFNVLETNKDEIIVEIPSIRTDIWHEIDIADDIARAYGYNNIIPTLPNISTIGKMLPINILIENLANFIVGLNYLELKTFSLTNNFDQFNKMNSTPQPHIKLGKNTQDSNLNMIRCWLIPSLMQALVANRSKQYPQKVFEIGTVIIPDETKDVKAKNQENLVCIDVSEESDFTKIKQTLDAILTFLDIEYQTIEIDHKSFMPGRCAKIVVNKTEIGFLGELDPQVLTNHGLIMPASALEINLDLLSDLI